MMKACLKCQTEKPLTEFWLSRGKPRTYCRGCDTDRRRQIEKEQPGYFADKTRASMTRKRDWLKSLKDRPCADCGVRYPFYVMDFDHRGDKSFNIGAGRGRSLASLQAEVGKCDVVCANCHRERTHKGRA
jgi:hypothetical protein